MAPSVDTAIQDIVHLRKVVASVRTKQITSRETLGHMKAVALAWFKRHRPDAPAAGLKSLDVDFQVLLGSAEKNPSTKRVRKILKGIRSKLISLQSELIAGDSVAAAPVDAAPSFQKIPDPQMQKVLTRRWNECVTCVRSGAPLAATVMMGGLLESLLLARINRDPNKAAVFTAKAAPKDKAGKTLGLKDWGLNDFIAVAHELQWITQGTKDVGQVLREYRNYIHPQKELAHQLALTDDDARMFWIVAKAIAVRLL